MKEQIWNWWSPWARVLASQVTLVVKNLPTNVGDIRDSDLIPGSGRSVGVGNGTPHQYSCLENSIPWAEEPGRLHSSWGCKELQAMKRLSRVSMTWDFITFISLEERSLFSSSLSPLPYWCSPNEVVSMIPFYLRPCSLNTKTKLTANNIDAPRMYLLNMNSKEEPVSIAWLSVVVVPLICLLSRFLVSIFAHF